MTTDNENLCYLKNFKFFWNFWGFDSSIEDWFSEPVKMHKNKSIGWKEFMLYFPLFSNWVSWKIGNDMDMCIG